MSSMSNWKNNYVLKHNTFLVWFDFGFLIEKINFNPNHKVSSVLTTNTENQQEKNENVSGVGL